MPSKLIRLMVAPATGPLAEALGAIPTALGISREYPADAQAEADAAAAHPVLPDLDTTDVPYVTIDPAGSMDLDQALYLEPAGDGYRVRYAIADVPSFVAPGGALDAETRRRGQTIYPPDGPIPLHPIVLSNGATSLLPGQVRSAFVWDFNAGCCGERHLDLVETRAHHEQRKARLRRRAEIDRRRHSGH